MKDLRDNIRSVAIGCGGSITPIGRVWGVTKTVTITKGENQTSTVEILAEGVTPFPKAANDRKG